MSGDNSSRSSSGEALAEPRIETTPSPSRSSSGEALAEPHIETTPSPSRSSSGEALAEPRIETLLDDAHRAFRDVLDATPDGAWFAPGRLNLVGEHTDYNGGFVLPLALERGAVACVRRRDDDLVRVHSTDLGSTVQVRLGEVGPDAGLDWAAYVAGVGWAAAHRGLPVPGIDLAVSSNVPAGAGLSSSAALSCVTARAWADLAGWDLPDVEIAALGRGAENHVAGAPTGVMDQLASVCGRKGHALEIDTRSVEITWLPFDPASAGLTLLMIDSRTPHALVDGAYAERRESCRRAAAALGVAELRDVPVDGLEQRLAELPDLLRRRARHVVTDSDRVEQAAALLTCGADPRELGPLLDASHASMRDDFEITVPTVDTIQRAAVAAGAYGARMTGGGFGGCVIALVDAAAVDRVTAAVTDAAARAGHPTPVAFVAEPGDGARRLR
ncbi:galactokinase [Barrientosiimonas humi]|uniref:galactokinase n=1 Tax=Barrientosiimonas humi TaxID=999931 RepID=UPI00370D581F